MRHLYNDYKAFYLLLVCFLYSCVPEKSTMPAAPTQVQLGGTNLTGSSCTPITAQQLTGGFGLGLVNLIDASLLRIQDPVVNILTYGNSTQSLVVSITPVTATNDPDYTPDYGKYSVTNADGSVCASGETATWFVEVPLPSTCSGVLTISAQGCANASRRQDPTKDCGPATTAYQQLTANTASALVNILLQLKDNETKRYAIAGTIATQARAFLAAVGPASSAQSNMEALEYVVAQTVSTDEKGFGEMLADPTLYEELQEVGSTLLPGGTGTTTGSSTSGSSTSALGLADSSSSASAGCPAASISSTPLTYTYSGNPSSLYTLPPANTDTGDSVFTDNGGTPSTHRYGHRY